MIKGKISEIFDSVQGEGIYLGEKQLFVRFFGCNLDCKYCDTKLKYFMEYEPDELVKELKLYQDHYHSVSFTGGEPLFQKDFLRESLKLTSRHGFKNYLESNGTLPDELSDVIDYLDVVAMDLKLPSSTGLDKYWHQHRKFLKIASAKEVFLKVVVCGSTLEDEVLEGIKLIKEVNLGATLVLQPNTYENHGMLDNKLKALKNICMKENITVCVIPQIHKIVGVE